MTDRDKFYNILSDIYGDRVREIANHLVVGRLRLTFDKMGDLVRIDHRPHSRDSSYKVIGRA